MYDNDNTPGTPEDLEMFTYFRRFVKQELIKIRAEYIKGILVTTNGKDNNSKSANNYSSTLEQYE